MGRFILAVVFVLSGAQAARAQTTQPFTLPPGGRAVVTFEAFCLDFGRRFPQTLQTPAGVASDDVRAVLAYAQNNQLTDDQNEAMEVQYAIWQVSGVSGSPQGGDLTQQIIGAAQNPPPAPQGTSLVDAARANQVQLTMTAWQPLGEQIQVGNVTDYFYGRGQLTVENTSQQELNLYMPIGTVFPSPSDDVQNMAGFQIDVQVQTPQQLPETGSSELSTTTMLVAIAGVLLAAGWLLRRRFVRS
jgi:LPXTG-motif cell wall-anchored protein